MSTPPPDLLERAAELRAAGSSWENAAKHLGSTPDELKALAAADRRAYRKLVREFLRDNMTDALAESVFFTRMLMRSEDEKISWKASDGYMRYDSNRYRHRDRVTPRGA